ncbi:hypothetical protein C0J52_22227 [Blattella germanica]|nr:hypothetical protein C0J52_22227 [Blattella germanica]
MRIKRMLLPTGIGLREDICDYFHFCTFAMSKNTFSIGVLRYPPWYSVSLSSLVCRRIKIYCRRELD